MLLITAALDDRTLAELSERSQSLGLTPLIEVHCAEELARVLPLGPPVIGINNRDLRDLSLDLGVTHRLRPLIPPGCIVVSESGIRTADDIRRLSDAGYRGFLVGEQLMRSPSPAAALMELTGKTAGRQRMAS